VTGRRSEEQRDEAPIVVDVIDRQQIESIGARDLGQILSTQPGVQIDRTFRGDAIQLQGLDPQHTLILVDGERLVGARDGAMDLTRFFASDIEQIEIVRGPASAIYGSDAMAGVINIITRPTAQGLTAAALGRYGATRGPNEVLSKLGHHGDGWLNVAAGAEQLRGRLSGGYRKEASFDLFPETPATSGNELELRNIQARVDYIPNDRIRVPFSLRMQRRDQRGTDDTSTGAVFDRHIRADELAFVLAPRITLRNHDALTTSAAYTQSRSQYLRDQRADDDGDTYEDSTERLASARAQYDATLTERLRITTGVEGLGQHFESPRLSKTGQRGRLSPYAQADITLADHPHAYVVFAPSARVDVDSQYGVNVSPRLSLRVDPSDGLILRAGAGRGFRAPSFTELFLDFSNAAANYRVSGNPALEPESSIGSNLSAEFSGLRWFIATLNLFRNDLRDLIDTGLDEVVGGQQFFTYVNTRRARTQGAEVTWSAKATRWLVVDLSYTLTHTRDLDANRALSGRSLQRGSGRLALGGGPSAWSASVRALIVGRRAFYIAETDQLTTRINAPAYASVDARAAYRVTSHVEPFLSGENLTDAGGKNLPLRPLTLYVGVSIF
jgi:outer membrane receptor for ferrienterochelin and colicins